MSILQKLKNNQPPCELYHYTSQNGLLGIFESDSLWATKIHYLNDETEFELALNLAAVVLNEKLQCQKDTREKEKIRCLIDNIPTIQKLNVCVISLSQKRDLLSQWRAYSAGIGGYSIGFKSDNLVVSASKQGFYLVRCIYEEDKQKQLISDLIDECLAEEFNTRPDYVDYDTPRTLVVLHTGGDFTKKLASIAPIIKNKSFSEEAEWRLISEKGLTTKSLSFRVGVSTLIPYFNFKIGSKADYLESLTIGPNPNPILARDATSLLLGRYGISTGYGIIPSAYIHETDIPFRNW